MHLSSSDFGKENSSLFTHTHKNHTHLITYFALGTTVSNVRKTGEAKGKTMT